MKFLDIAGQDRPIKKKILKDIRQIINQTDFISGNKVVEFEKKFSEYCGSKFAIGCANGTDAIFLALKSLNLKKNSEVILPAMTFCSTAFSVINAGLKPVLVDIDQNKPIVSLQKVKKKINKNTKAIILVHLYGQSCEVQNFINFKKNKKIFIIEDASQAHGAYDCSNCQNSKEACCKKGLKVGSSSDVSCFSLYPGKNLGAYGDAGIITTNNKKIYRDIKKLGNLGSEKKFFHDVVGVNSRLDTLQASILLNKLPNLDKLNEKRKKIANFYTKNIKNKKIIKLEYSKGCVYHQFVIIVKGIDRFINHLNRNKIPFGRHYPYAIHQLSSLKKYFKNQKFPLSEKLAKNGISLPIDPNLKKADLESVVKAINKF